MINSLESGWSVRRIHQHLLSMVGGSRLRTMSLRTLYRIKLQWEEKRDLHHKWRNGGGLGWSQEELNRLFKFVRENPDAYLDEIVDFLRDEVGKTITESGLWKLMEKMNQQEGHGKDISQAIGAGA